MIIRFPLVFLMACVFVLPTFSTTQQQMLIDDFEDGNNSNNFEYYWYYHDDNYRISPDSRPIAGQGTTPSTIDVPYVLRIPDRYESSSGGFRVKDYEFTIKEESSNKFATMPFTFGEKWRASWCGGKPCAYPSVDIGTMLCAEGGSVDCTRSTGLRFRMRSHSNVLTVTLIVETKDIKEDSNEVYFQKNIECSPGVWNDYTVLFSELAQPVWTTPEYAVDFDIKNIANIVWFVTLMDNPDISRDTLDIDDVILVDGKITVIPGAFDVWTKTERTPPQGGLFANFERAPKHAITIHSQNLTQSKKSFVNFISTRGSIIHQSTFVSSVPSIILPTPNLPAGRYIVQIKGTLQNGKAFSEQTSVVIIR